MAEASSKVSVSSTGTPVDGVAVTDAGAVGAGLALRQAVALGDGGGATNFAKVSPAGSLSVDGSGGLTTRLDYAARTDSNPVYIGQASPGASDTDAASTAWTVKVFAYDASARTTSIKVATGIAWFNRATATYL